MGALFPNLNHKRQKNLALGGSSFKFGPQTKIAQNKKFLNGEFHPSKATLEDNRDRSNSNSDRCDKIEDTAMDNKKKIIEVQSNTEKNSVDILKNAVQISERREKINSLQTAINENQTQVAEMISFKIK